MGYTKALNQLNKQSSEVAGGKGASLGDMIQAGIPVPSGFVVLTKAYEEFVKNSKIRAEIDVVWSSINLEDMASIEHASGRIVGAILESEVTEDIQKSIFDMYEGVGAEFVAVRSSATAEDSDSAAWAGQLESYLYINRENLIESVKKCWASLFSPRAISYRFERENGRKDIAVAVVVQKMINSEVAGVAFSVHPVTQDKNQMIIEAVWGLGEMLVNGSTTPDSYIVEKDTLSITDISRSIQETMLTRVADGAQKAEVPTDKREKQKLTEDQIEELSELVVLIENHYGCPQDIEWALEKGKLYIVQSRPITTLS